MAITKTTTLAECYVRIDDSVIPEGEGPWLVARYVDVIDDPDDDELPIQRERMKTFTRDDDLTGEDQIIQDIAAAVWA